MAVQNWIDEIVKQMGKINSHTGGKLKTYRVATKAEIPEALGVFPCAIIYPTRLVSAQYSQGGPCKEIWEVVGEFYIFPDVKKTNVPVLVTYFKKIRDATLASMTLGGKVDHFVFAETDPMGLATGPYEVDGPDRHAIVANWEVKSDVTAEVTVGV